ncbi:unnamed protein product [Arabidopsis lyrata]|nr:unnamed protein product [Arabidopsis lyrata]
MVHASLCESFLFFYGEICSPFRSDQQFQKRWTAVVETLCNVFDIFM